jgi:very-short-patch-repair endonuclease
MVDQHASPEAKVALFRSLFRGRDDVYPRRFENRRTGRSGYQPACANEWLAGICEKPRIKCSDCRHQHFLPVTDETIRWHLSGHLYDELIVDAARNALICDEVLDAVRAGRSPIVLTERKAHLDRLAAQLGPAVRHLVVLRGGLGASALRARMEQLEATAGEDGRVLLATGGYIGEGFDDARLDTLFLTLPVSWQGKIAQYVGRLHRLHDRKREVRVYDYADLNVPVLARMFERRCRGYRAAGYSILAPGSAVPGWPVEVPLPANAAWKRDHAESVLRLAGDGVGAPLASLFVAAARVPAPDAEGTDRARSAAEAFLYQRLQTLPWAAGRFDLNTELAIPFDGQGRMEVDLLCAEARVAIELDGARHFDSPEAHRRDRHKDQLLQENGYFVLRFLSEDVSRQLDRVLDTIGRVLSWRCRQASSGGGDDLRGEP